MDEARSKALALYKEVKETHGTVFVNMQRAKDAIRELQDLDQIVDVIAVLKKSEDLLRDTKSQVSSLTGKLMEVACKLYMQSNQIGEPIRTEWVTGTPDIKVKPSIPTLKNNPEGYINMCHQLGYPVAAHDVEVFRPHYPGIQEYLSKIQELGLQMPEWVDESRSGSEFGMRCLWKRDVDLDQLVNDV